MEAPVTCVDLGIRGSVKEQGNTNPFALRTHVSAKVVSEDKIHEKTILPGFVQPAQLACADVVLTSYSVVQRELDWAEVVASRQSGHGHRPKLRLTQRYLCRPSPLTCVRWWRICLDEAQMVERVTSKTARMLSQITAVNRWCVTGTPAEKSIDDFFGLFAYLRLTPYSFSHYWNSLLYQPFLAACSTSWGKETLDSENDLKPEMDNSFIDDALVISLPYLHLLNERIACTHPSLVVAKNNQTRRAHSVTLANMVCVGVNEEDQYSDSVPTVSGAQGHRNLGAG
ncbi:unnamed protein product [Trichobilharzia regenti]|nr:unnamed protein product [Trichobilharzia regenti]